MATSTSTSSIHSNLPCVVRDARFKCGRKLMELGHLNQAVDVFAILLEQTRLSFGDCNVETVPVYYEYGNALLRQYQNTADSDVPQDQARAVKVDRRREAAAAAAERRIQTLLLAAKKNDNEEEDEEEKKLPTVALVDGKKKVEEEEEEESKDDDEDLKLALEMMETSWSILDESLENEHDEQDSSSSSNTKYKYSTWLKEQAPRILTGLGDVLSALNKHPDAVDAYLRALEYRQSNVDRYKDLENPNNNNSSNDPDTLLKAFNCHRLVVECCVLIAQGIIDCCSSSSSSSKSSSLSSSDQHDIVTSETNTVLVKGCDRIDYARGYYDKSREELQETTLLMANIVAAATTAGGVDIIKIKQDVCFAATLVMGVGVALEMIEEEEQEQQEPSATKKLKTTR